MSGNRNPIESIIDIETAPVANAIGGSVVSEMLTAYGVYDRSSLLGFLLKMDYDELTLVTCDAWKRNCGGVPKNSFILVRLNEKAAAYKPADAQPFLILARVRETAMTPVTADVQSTIFQIHKVQAAIDPMTNAELQWGALKADILGTYYDTPDKKIAFGNDIDSFISPHFYEIYVPKREHLEVLINSFVAEKDPIQIGRLRYTETETLGTKDVVPVSVSPDDFLCNRTALFGKTRMGKSNTIKVILDTMLKKEANLGQIVFDLSGEYTYPDPQTGGSLYLTYQDKCSRYSLNPRTPERERLAGAPPPKMLKTNFYRQIALGHYIIGALFDTKHPRRPDYMSAFFAWEPVDEDTATESYPDEGDRTRYLRALSMYKAFLQEAGFAGGERLRVQLYLKAPIKQRLAALPGVADFATTEIDRQGNQQLGELQSLRVAARIYERLWALYDANRGDATLFPISRRTGKPYFDGIHECFLRMLGSTSISGPKKITPFTDYHDPRGGNLAESIVNEAEQGKTVLIDLAQADQQVSQFYTEMLAKAVLAKQMEKFATLSTENFENQSILFYFEEAHNLFRADDKDLKSTYNKLAKEGAKFRIGMVYATQSMTTLSPDLLKNTENFFIAHLNDDREVKEIERRYEFAGLGLDIQRARSKGYVRMITLSHRYALPVQIRLFTPAAADPSEGGVS